MFRFEDIEVGTDKHGVIMDVIGKALENDEAVNYEEYVVREGSKTKTKFSDGRTLRSHAGRVVYCRGTIRA